MPGGGKKESRAQAPRSFCWTLNNPGEWERKAKETWDTGLFCFLFAGMETGESGTPHLQGYAEVKHPPLKFNRLKKLPLFAGAHIEKRRGTVRQAVDYCAKDGNVVIEYGATNKKQGAREDLAALTKTIKTGATMAEIFEKHPECVFKYSKGIEVARKSLIQPRDHKIPKIIHIYYGESGTGKTRYAVEQHPGAHMQKPGMAHWWDGYEGQKVVILDEYRSQFQFGTLLGLLDRYNEKVQYKGGSCNLVCDKIIITMPVHPKFLYLNLERDREGRMYQLQRRIAKIYEFTGDPENPTMTDKTDEPWE